MNSLSKVFLITIFLWLPDFFPNLEIEKVRCFFEASANKIVDFGQSGNSGENGIDGNKGRDSEALTVFADGSAMNLDISGEDGSKGDNGSSGDNAQCENQPLNVDYNLSGANGSSGGEGGNGGDGGHAGSLTVYTSNKDYLKTITVDASGGNGGQPGKGGNGGSGCQCPQPYWTVETCTGKPGSADYACSTKEYRCLSGENGKNGKTGRKGRDGKLGTLTLINSSTPLPPDRITASVSMDELKSRGFSLSKNIWETHQGAKNLFASGSILNDQYLELVERVESAVVVVWNAPQSFTPYKDKNLTLSLQDDRNIKITLPQDIWFQTQQTKKNNVTEYLVFNAMNASDATKLKSKGLSDYGDKLTLEIIDEAEKSDIVNTTFTIRYSVSTSADARFRKVNDYTLRYQGEIPSNLITYRDHRFVLNLGQLPIDSRYLNLDTAIEVEIEAKRSFGDYSAVQKIVITDILGPFN